MLRHSGVEHRSSGVHIDAGHHTTLALVVSIANVVQEVKTGTDTANQELNPSIQLSLAHTTLRSPLTPVSYTHLTLPTKRIV